MKIKSKPKIFILGIFILGIIYLIWNAPYNLNKVERENIVYSKDKNVNTLYTRIIQVNSILYDINKEVQNNDSNNQKIADYYTYEKGLRQKISNFNPYIYSHNKNDQLTKFYSKFMDISADYVNLPETIKDTYLNLYNVDFTDEQKVEVKEGINSIIERYNNLILEMDYYYGNKNINEKSIKNLYKAYIRNNRFSIFVDWNNKLNSLA